MSFWDWIRPRPPVPPPQPPPPPPGVPGDYAKIAMLDFRTDDDKNGAPSAVAGAIAHVQRYLRDGMNVPVSQQYIRLKADLSDGNPRINRGSITAKHGTSSGRLMWQMLHTHGVCPMSMCPDENYVVPTKVMDDAAVPYRVGSIQGLAEFPNYSAILNHLKTHHGDGALLTTDGYESYAIIGVDAQGRGIWVGYYGTGSKAAVKSLDLTAGQALMDDLIQGNHYGTPDNYMVLIQTR